MHTIKFEGRTGIVESNDIMIQWYNEIWNMKTTAMNENNCISHIIWDDSIDGGE